MKKHLSVLFVILITMAIMTSTALAAPALDTKSVILVSVEYQQGGIALLFHTSGLTRGDLNDRSFYAHSNYRNIYCNFVDDTTDVRCVVSKKLSNFAGESFHVTLAGFGFYDELPAKPSPVCSDGQAEWYYIDVSVNGEYDGSFEVPTQVWNQVVADGILQELESSGIVFEVTGSFCGPADFEPA